MSRMSSFQRKVKLDLIRLLQEYLVRRKGSHVSCQQRREIRPPIPIISYFIECGVRFVGFIYVGYVYAGLYFAAQGPKFGFNSAYDPSTFVQCFVQILYLRLRNFRQLVKSFPKDVKLAEKPRKSVTNLSVKLTQ